VGRHRGLWGAAQARQASRTGGQVPEQALRPRRLAGQERAEALQTFLAGRGDVLLSYENEAIFAQKHDQPIDYVMPKSTIQIANPIAVVKTSTNKTGARPS
jgi:ABC-type sulfate transport system, periplasmic component